MTALDYILVGLEKNLELEKELGKWVFEIDRGVLENGRRPAEGERDGVERKKCAGGAEVENGKVAGRLVSEGEKNDEEPAAVIRSRDEVEKFDGLVFLHDGMLSQAAVGVMAKITQATKERLGCESKLVVAEPVPSARAYISLGKAAEIRYAKVREGMSRDAFGVSFSPEEFVRFADSPAVKAKKLMLWEEIKKKSAIIKAGRA